MDQNDNRLAHRNTSPEWSKPHLDQKLQSRLRLDAPAQRSAMMGRSFGKLLSRIWEDEDFLALETGPQRMYGFLVSQANLNHAGLLPLTLKKWSKKAKSLTVAQVEQDLAVLDAARFIVLDEDTEELLVRTYIRNDDIWKAPRMMGAAVSGAQEIESRRLRRALLIEAGRIPVHELSDEPTKGRDGRPAPSIRTQVQGHIRTLQAMFADLLPAPGAPSGPPSPSPSRGGFEAPSGGGSASLREGAPEPPPDPLPQPPAEPPPEGGNQGGPEGGNQGANARRRGPAPTRVTPTPTPTPSSSSPQATNSLGYPQPSGGSNGEETDPNHTAAALPRYEDLASPDDESPFLRAYAQARLVIDVLADREEWLAAARRHLAETGDEYPAASQVTVTAARLYQAKQQPDQPPPIDNAGAP